MDKIAVDTEGIDVAVLDTEALLELCDDGHQGACAELDRRGVEPPMIEPEHSDLPMPSAMPRSEALALIGQHAVGRAIVGVEVDEHGTATLRVEGGCKIILPAKGGLLVEDGRWEGFPVVTDERVPEGFVAMVGPSVCDCGHSVSDHINGSAACLAAGCGCVRFRDPADVRAALLSDPRGEHDR